MSTIASSSNLLKFHQWPEGLLQQTYFPANYNDGPIKSISWGKDGTWVVLVPHLGPVQVISIKENVKGLHTVRDIYNPTCAMFQNSTKKNIAVGTLAGQVLIYDVKTKTIRKRFPRASSTIFSLVYNANDTHIAAACTNGEVLLFNNATCNISCSYKVPMSETASVINFHHTKRNMLAAGSEEGMVAIWDINTNIIPCTLLAHQAPVTDLTFSPIRSDLFVTSGLDRRVSFCDFLVKKPVLEIEVGNSASSLDFSCCGKYLGLGSHDGNVVLYDPRNISKPISQFLGHEGRKIRHLFFQKVPIANDVQSNSTFDFVSEDLSSEQRHQEYSHQSVDSLRLLACDDSNAKISTELGRKLSQDIEDSFLKAMGLDNSAPGEPSLKQDTTTGLGRAEVVQTLVDGSKRPSLSQTNVNYLPEQVTVLQTPDVGIKRMSSTPSYLTHELPVFSVSPIVAPSGDIPQKNAVSSNQIHFSVKDLKQIMKEVIKEELEAYKEEMTMESAETLAHIRRHFLEVEMLLVKQNVDLEIRLDRSNNTTVKEFICDNYLISENNRLRTELESLKQLVERDFALHRKN